MRHIIARPALAGMMTLGCGAAYAQQSTAVPTVVQAPNTGHAYNAAMYSKVPQNLSNLNYLEAEYFISGTANAYTYTTPASASDAVTVLPGGPVAYTNRILVRAPVNPSKASGNVIVEVINDALTGDNLTQWPYAQGEFIKNGDVWIGLTSTPVGVQALKNFSAARYGALAWPGLPSSAGCANSTSVEPGVIYDEISQLGNLIRQKQSAINPGGVYPVNHVFLTSYSVSSQILLTYNRVFGAANSALWNGYMISSGGYRAMLNACESQLAALYRATGPTSTTAAVFQTQTISETEQGTVPRGTDSDSATDRYRYYDLAGASHVNQDLINAQPNSADLAAAGAQDVNQSVATNSCMEPGVVSTFPNHVLYDALWDNLEKLVDSGTVPPHATPMSYAASETGQAVGGVRSPGVDAPMFMYFGGGPVVVSGANHNLCALLGYQVPLSASAVANAYGSAGFSGSIYMQRVILSAMRNTAARFITTTDLAALIADPASSAGE